MKILAFELSTALSSLAWADGETILAREWRNERKSSAPFFENLKSVSEQYGAPDAILVGLGPGSYAGVRIAISAAVGLQAATGARLVGLSSLCAFECAAPEYVVIGDARRSTFFHARVRVQGLLEEPILLNEKDLQRRLGDLDKEVPVFSSEALPQFERVTMRFPSAILLAKLLQAGEGSFVLPPLEPMYLREPHITMPKQTPIALS